MIIHMFPNSGICIFTCRYALFLFVSLIYFGLAGCDTARKPRTQKRQAGTREVVKEQSLLGELFQGPTMYYHSLNLDTVSMSAELVEPIPGQNPPRQAYYTYCRDTNGVAIYHIDGSKNLPYRVCYNMIAVNNDNQIIIRGKIQELATGPYGTVLAGMTFDYRTVWRDGRGSRRLDIGLADDRRQSEPPQVVEDLPWPRPQMMAISVVRVFRKYPEYAVASAVYDKQGILQRTSYFGSQSSKIFDQQDSNFDREKVAFNTNQPGALSKYGMLSRFPITEYIRHSVQPWKATALPNLVNIVNFHYDYNRWVRQDNYDASGKITTRYLTYVVTPEDRILEPIDRKIPFDQIIRK